MKVPFAPPRIDDIVINAVSDALRSGWITTGPRTKQFEKALEAYCKVKKVLCLNSATAGLETALRWYGIGLGDEVILPAYTYSSTANVIIHCGAKPVFVDVLPDFNIDPEEIKKKINSKTKAVISVDFAGWPVDYDSIRDMIHNSEVKSKFIARNQKQADLGRVIHISDAAHALGATYKGNMIGVQADITVFSFHAVKNLTTAEGGAMVLNLPEPFDNNEIYRDLVIFTLHGQTKDALAKYSGAGWRYDIVEAGYKYNMPDILAAIGLVELARYEGDTLIKRKGIFAKYDALFSKTDFALCPQSENNEKTSSYHVYALRLKGFGEQVRDRVIETVTASGVAVNVHFIPIPMFSYYKNLGYNISDYPVTFNNYKNEISLPVFYDMTDEQINMVFNAVKDAVVLALQKQ